jgi:hypothetical protein
MTTRTITTADGTAMEIAMDIVIIAAGIENVAGITTRSVATETTGATGDARVGSRLSAVRAAILSGGDHRERGRIAQLEPEPRRDLGERTDHPLHVRKHRDEMLARSVAQRLVFDQRRMDHESTDRLAQRVDEPADLIDMRGAGERQRIEDTPCDGVLSTKSPKPDEILESFT